MSTKYRVGDRVRVVANVDEHNPECDRMIGQLGTVIRIGFRPNDPGVDDDICVVLDSEPLTPPPPGLWPTDWDGTVRFVVFLPVELEPARERFTADLAKGRAAVAESRAATRAYTDAEIAERRAARDKS